MTRSVFLAAGLLAAAVLSGCAKKPPPLTEAGGRVTLNGHPLPKALVTFYPQIEFGAEFIATGETDEDGRFTLICPAGTGVCACDNLVTVIEGPLPEGYRNNSIEGQAKVVKYQATLKNRPIPGKYSNLAQSPLKIKVATDCKDYDLELTR
jgi:hypothetical protein